MKTRHLNPRMLLAITAVMTSAPVLAGGGHNAFMHKFDLNNDGTVTQEEFRQASGERFKQMDADHDGTVSGEEFSKYIANRRAERHQRYFALADTNKDGNISREEYLEAKRQRAERKFARLDKNGDGVISSDEFASGKHRKGHWGGGDFSKKIFARMDTNKDGKITQGESLDAWTQWFKRMDSNGDNVVTTDEVKQARDKYKHESREKAKTP